MTKLFIFLCLLISLNCNAEWRDFKDVEQDFNSDNEIIKENADGEFGVLEENGQDRFVIQACSRKGLKDFKGLYHLIIITFDKNSLCKMDITTSFIGEKYQHVPLKFYDEEGKHIYTLPHPRKYKNRRVIPRLTYWKLKSFKYVKLDI